MRGIRRSSRCICWRRSVEEQRASCARCSRQIGVNQRQLRQIVTAELKHLPKASGGAPPQLESAN